MSKSTKMIRAYSETKDKFAEMKREIANIERKDLGFPELLRRIVNIPTLKDTLSEDAKRFKNMKRGQTAIIKPTILILILIILIGTMIIGYFLYSIFSPIGLFILNDATNILQDSAADDGNLSATTNITFGAVNRTVQNIEWISYALLFGFIFVFIVVAFFVRSYPFLIVFWIGFCIILVFCSIYLSVTYEDIRNADGYLRAAFDEWAVNDYLMRHLPHFTIAFTMLTGIVLFAINSLKTDTESSTL